MSQSRRVGRLNVGAKRKEWRERGRPTLVVGGGIIVGEALSVSLAATPSPAGTSTVVTLAATAAGGSAPYSYTFTGPAGIQLVGSGSTRSFTTPGAATAGLAFSATVTDTLGVTAAANETLDVVAASRKLHAGHVPNRVLFGMAASENLLPTFDQAYEIFKGASSTRALSERRVFVSAGISRSALLGMLAKADAHGLLPWVSFKHSNFADFYEGRMDATLDIIAQVARERGASRPFIVGVYHEPAGDAGIVLSEWSKMQVYNSDYLAGWKPDGLNGTGVLRYLATRDVRSICAYSSIMNGNKWGPNRSSPTEMADSYPQKHIDRFRENGSVLAWDCYDGSPGDPLRPNAGHVSSPDGLISYPATADRTSEKMKACITWARARNCGALGFGEFSATEANEITRCWEVLRANRDIVTVANYFNSAANSKWEWRLVGATFPQMTERVEMTDYWRGKWGPCDTPAPTHDGWREVGGTVYTEAMLNAYRAIVAESTTAAFTSAL